MLSSELLRVHQLFNPLSFCSKKTIDEIKIDTIWPLDLSIKLTVEGLRQVWSRKGAEIAEPRPRYPLTQPFFIIVGFTMTSLHVKKIFDTRSTFSHILKPFTIA